MGAAYAAFPAAAAVDGGSRPIGVTAAFFRQEGVNAEGVFRAISTASGKPVLDDEAADASELAHIRGDQRCAERVSVGGDQ